MALARALAVEPRVLLLDEPFGALDAKVRRELRQWLRRLHDELHIASVFVTHDQEEALEVADRVAILSDGNIEQVGTPDQDLPASGKHVRRGVPAGREPSTADRGMTKPIVAESAMIADAIDRVGAIVADEQ